VAALSGRPAPPKPVHRSALPGIVLLIAGPVLLAFSGGWGASNSRDTLFKLGGLLGTTMGLLLLAPVCVSVLGAIARRAPLAVRLALRDLARYRARSGAALAAVSFSVLIAVIISLLATGRYADPLDYFGPNLPADQLLVYPPGTGPDGGPDPGGTGTGTGTGQSQADPGRVAEAIAASVGSHDVLALESTDASLVELVTQGARGFGRSLPVATPEVLRHFGIDPATIDPTALLVTSRQGLDRMPSLALTTGRPDYTGDDPCPAGRCVAKPKIQRLSQLPTGTSDPNLLLTAHAVDVLKLQVAPAGWLVGTAGPLTDAQINTARQAAAAAGMTIETKSGAPSLSQLRNFSTAAGILLALAILAMTVGLIRSETASDLQTLAATGAGSLIRRSITAATAGALGLLGALLGTATAYLAAVALFRSELSVRMSAVPVLDLTLILVGLPLAAMVGSWLLAGREPSAIRRQPLE
jgi:putative ABC transport system permease protein